MVNVFSLPVFFFFLKIDNYCDKDEHLVSNLSSFKSVMLNYYFTALDNYDCDNPRTFTAMSMSATVLIPLLVQLHVAVKGGVSRF